MAVCVPLFNPTELSVISEHHNGNLCYLTGSSTLNRGRVMLQRKRGSRHTSSWHAPQHNQERSIVMDPTTVFCPNLACPARGQTGQGNIGIHSQKEQRFICQARCHRWGHGSPYMR